MPEEKRDCTVRAVAQALRIPYPEAYNRLAKLGRKPDTGFDFGCFADPLGFEMRVELAETRLGDLAPVLQRGRFVLTTLWHVFPVVHGIVSDLVITPPHKRIRMVYEVVDKNSALDGV